MIETFDIASLDRYKHNSPFTGSYKGMRFRIIHPKKTDDEEYVIIVDVYPGPYCFEKTVDDLKVRTTYPYSMEGYEQIVPYLNNYYEEHKDMWAESLSEALSKYSPKE